MKPTDLQNPDYYHKVVDCQWACPAHTPVPEYFRLIAAGRYSQGQTVGKGFLGLATLVVGNWRPVGVAIGASIFGFFDGITQRLGPAQLVLALLLAAALLFFVGTVYAFVNKAATALKLVAVVVCACAEERPNITAASAAMMANTEKVSRDQLRRLLLVALSPALPIDPPKFAVVFPADTRTICHGTRP